MRWALAGHGALAPRIVEALRAHGESVDVVWGRSADRAREFADEHGIERAGQDADALFRDADAVYVATPVVSHVPLARRALLCGCHVVVEKPISANLASAEPLVELAERRQRVIGVAYYRRLFSGAERIAGLLRTGRCGLPVSVRVRWSGPFDPEPGDPQRWRTDPAVAGAGVLADTGSHRLDLLVWLLGRPDGIRAQLAERFPVDTERRADLDLSWPDGIAGAINLRWESALDDMIELTFDRGVLRWDLRRATLRWDGRGGGWEEQHRPAPNPHQNLVADFVAAVDGARRPVCPLADALVTDRVIEAALRSDAVGGGWQPM